MYRLGSFMLGSYQPWLVVVVQMSATLGLHVWVVPALVVLAVIIPVVVGVHFTVIPALVVLV